MHIAAYLALVASLLLCLALIGAGAWSAWQGRLSIVDTLEKGHAVQTALITFSSFLLLWAFVNHDFSFKYVRDYSDLVMPLFYTVTAFWAGQAGSLLFWAWTTALFGAVLPMTRGYASLSRETRLYYWLFYYVVMAFFLLLLTNWSNPFIQLVPAPTDGNGLNPLLQNPAMIFHPPLLFMGYAGFTVPACLALAQAVTGDMARLSPRASWLGISRNFNLVSWLLLSAGIILGAWWSYMELGWGGYWAWDPVENASLIPWLTATACLHTGVIESRRGTLRRTNVFLMVLTLLSCFFGTYLVRSGVVDSLHAFGSGGVGSPLLIFILAATAVALWLSATAQRGTPRPLGGLANREGFLIMTAWMLLVLGLVILAGTMWPVFSKLWSPNPVGLDAGFYNRVCLPLFVAVALLLTACPWLGWKSGLRNARLAGLVGVLFLAACAVVWALGYTLPMTVLGAGGASAAVLGIALLFAREPRIRRRRAAWAAYGVHVGLALMVLGVAFSGPYKVEREAVVKAGESFEVGGYTVTYQGLRQGQSPAMVLIEARLQVSRDGKPLGALLPQRRLYSKFPNPYAEASVIPGLGDELYATLLGADDQGHVSLKISVHPLINWIWIGGTLLCLFPFLGLTRFRAREAVEPVRKETPAAAESAVGEPATGEPATGADA
ncbi:MAG: heme lyase CcmF/NrfE family subunit [Desulfovibrionaceae bacterium]|jgi:cytochrome c-type biogenesis protein CcmF|nr:heme lyase CcmF/NrfE family subunit [Desulfovibrionaceae bacterium]